MANYSFSIGQDNERSCKSRQGSEGIHVDAQIEYRADCAGIDGGGMIVQNNINLIVDKGQGRNHACDWFSPRLCYHYEKTRLVSRVENIGSHLSSLFQSRSEERRVGKAFRD